MSKKKGKNRENTPSSLSDEDSRLFRDTIGDIEKFQTEEILPSKNKPSPLPKKSIQDQNQVIEQLSLNPFSIPELQTGDELNFYRPGVQKQTLRKLRRGQFVIESELDLHGLTSIEAKSELIDFINYCHSSGKRCVRIIHGKGHGSKNKLPVLKNKLNVWLQRREDILAFCSARDTDGGTGAVYVLLAQTK